jgi:RNA-directed DNA polymerase
LSALDSKDERVDVIKKIYRKLSQLPNTGHMEVWLQRISHSFEPKLAYEEQLCNLVMGRSVDVWNNSWITSTKLKAALDPSQIVNKPKLRALKPVIKPNEIKLFANWMY